jgi:hypothetical protein
VLWLAGRRGSAGFSMPIAMLAALLLLIGMAALGARSSQGFLASSFQGVNREARDVAESAITDFAVTLNREENRRLLVAGNDQQGQWASNAAHRNPCSGQFAATNPPSGQLVAVAGTAAATSADRFVRNGTWQNLMSGDGSRQFLVEDLTYRYEDRTAGSARTPFDSTTINANIPTHTVRNAALQGGTRTLLRVTIQGRVVRNGQTSLARVTREFEVVPKCCKRSFGRHSGLGSAQSEPAWGTDPVLECPLAFDDGAGRGILGALSGGAPSGSNNTLDIADEANNLITRALCWAGNETATSDLDGTPNPDCLSGDQALGRATKSKPGITFVPSVFDLVLPRPQFGDGTGSGFDGGWIGTPSGVMNVALLNAAFPSASFGNWVVTNGNVYWMKTFGTWVRFDTRSSTASFSACSSTTTNMGACRTEPFFTSLAQANPGAAADYAAPHPAANKLYGGTANSLGAMRGYSLFPRAELTISGNTAIYLDPVSMQMQRNGTPMTNCIVSKQPAAAYAVADCRFRTIASGNQTLTIDTTYAMINLHFDDAAFTGEYMGGSGNTAIRRVHCSRSGYVPGSCSDVETWADFQIKCNPGAGSLADPNCTTVNNAYDHSELFNAFATGAGRFTLNGTSATVGVNVYAPRATVELIGGGNAYPNFMGRVWTNNIVITGNTSMRSPVSHPSFCANHRCPPPAKIPLYDMIARSFSHASGF